NVLALPDEWRGRPHLRRQRYLAVQSSRPASRRVATRRQLRQYPVERGDEPARLAPGRPGQKAAGAIPLAAFPTAPRVGGVEWRIAGEPGQLSMDLVSRGQSGPGRAR